MKIDIYNSAVKGDKFLSVAKGTKIKDLKLPDSVDTDILTLSPFRTRLEIDPAKPHPALDQNDVIKQLETNGYAIHNAKILIKIGDKTE